jgi:hypothetical protein
MRLNALGITNNAYKRVTNKETTFKRKVSVFFLKLAFERGFIQIFFHGYRRNDRINEP